VVVNSAVDRSAVATSAEGVTAVESGRAAAGDQVDGRAAGVVESTTL
jgi:hypothetical protein